MCVKSAHLFVVPKMGVLRPVAPFLPVTIENSTCDISSATTSTLFLCCVRVVNQNTRALLLVFVVFTQCDVCRQSPTFQHKHNIRRDTRKKNDKIDESSKIERMGGNPGDLMVHITLF